MKVGEAGMALNAAKELDRRCVWNWLNDVYRNPKVAFNTYSDEQQIEFAHDALVLLKDQEAVEPRRDAICVRMFRCGACSEYVGFIDSHPGDHNEQDNYCRKCGRKVKWE